MATLAPPDPGLPRAEAAAPALSVAVSAAEPCPSCGKPIADEYCGACGERRPRPEHLSARSFLRELREDVLDLDGRALRSFRLLLTRPGLLTLEVLRGRRKQYLGAIKMYLGVFALTMLVSSLVAARAEEQGPQSDVLSRGVGRVVHMVAAHRGISDAAAQQAVLQATMQHESWIALCIPLLFAAVLFALFRGRRRWFGEHLLFATHFGAFNYVFGLLLLPFQFLHIEVWKVALLAGALAAPAAMIAYLAIAFRRVYGGGRGASVGWGVGLLLCFGMAQGIVALAAFLTATIRLAYF
ncbi:MAG TPA: DUF3667 domain-containing protein [Longimicrobium sp.]|nr:DUF3667 domain-containing protein [Longimicrobium sp.]